MTLWVYVPIVLSAALALLARPIATGSAPAVAARALAGAALIAAMTSTASLILLVATLLDRLPPPLVARNEPGRPRLPEPVPDAVAIVAIVLLMIALIRYGVDVRRRDAVHRGLHSAGRPGDDGVVIADWSAPFAVAIPGRPGHILLTTGMIRLLSADERRVVLAHERAHLARGHHRLTAIASTAAALNPILVPARDAVSYLVERWADEDAATEVGDRHLTARSVAKAALATLTPHDALTPRETGTPREAGAPHDSSAPRYSGLPHDADAPQESGPPRDSRLPHDISAPHRLGAPRDSGLPHDAGTPQESSAPREVGAPHDSGVPREAGEPRGFCFPQESGLPHESGAPRSSGTPWVSGIPGESGAPRESGLPRDAGPPGGAWTLSGDETETPGVTGMHGSRRGHALGRVRAMTDPAAATRRTRAGLLALALLSIAFIAADAVAATDFVVFATAWMP
ncbi:hypothetical protein J2S43_004372 [Catenuloplanes nepalensis]|uniref:Peptidase M48 domain-containing protein n=1 Tax=Catenuloplanes nepalensis TaxID=587533 RepID=A0ABT9MWP9_9ACTN|nr:M56 family metallopeptidase [Catenuloplanes nepalensis]MDP9795860.1 hypothetical protein [Catenuloplanes nepalensis]